MFADSIDLQRFLSAFIFVSFNFSFNVFIISWQNKETRQRIIVSRMVSQLPLNNIYVGTFSKTKLGLVNKNSKMINENIKGWRKLIETLSG